MAVGERLPNLVKSSQLGRTLRMVAGLAMVLLSIAWLRWSDPVGAELAAPCFLAWSAALYATWDSKVGLASPITLYFLVFGLFHFGLIWAVALTGSGVLIAGAESGWVYSVAGTHAVEAAMVGLAALLLGAAAIQPLSPTPRSEVGARYEIPTRARAVSVTVFTASSASLALVIFAARSELLNGSYHQFLEATAGTMFGYSVFGFTLGCGLMVAAGGKFRRIGWVGFVIFSAVALPIGLRGTVLFPALSLLYVEGRRRRLSTGLLAMSAVGVLALASVIKNARAEGVAGLFGGRWKIDLFGAIAEMGYSIYPTVVVQDWMATGTEPRGGVTLVSVPLRLVEGLLGLPVPRNDERLFNIEIANRAGPIGGSPIAEGLRNGNVPFLVAMMFLIGLVIAVAARAPHSWTGNAAALAVLTPMFLSVRNSFAPVPVQIVIGLAVVWLGATPSRRDRHEGRSRP